MDPVLTTLAQLAPPDYAQAFVGLFFLCMIGGLIVTVIFLVAIWRAMKAHESIAQTLYRASAAHESLAGSLYRIAEGPGRSSPQGPPQSGPSRLA